MQRNIDFSMIQWLLPQLAVSGGELAASGDLRLFHSPSNRRNFAAGFRRDTQVSDTLQVHPASCREGSYLSRKAETVFFFSQNREKSNRRGR